MSLNLDVSTLKTLKGWQGKRMSTQDIITSAPLRALSATLDRDDPAPVLGTSLPPLWHWLFFLPHTPQSQLDLDGHAKRGGFLPPVPLPRRMWAGGKVHWHAHLRVGDEVERVSTIDSVSHKIGRAGDLVFVQVKHQIHNAHGLCLTELHDIVYRPLALPCDLGPTPVAAHQKATWQREVAPDEVLLFRYSALTFNGHRIHYDRSYVTEVEGYPGLVVHGPLIATLLLDLVRRHTDRAVVGFEFKALRPTFVCADRRPMRLCGKPDVNGQTIRLWAQDHEGWLTMQASAELA